MSPCLDPRSCHPFISTTPPGPGWGAGRLPGVHRVLPGAQDRWPLHPHRPNGGDCCGLCCISLKVCGVGPLRPSVAVQTSWLEGPVCAVGRSPRSPPFPPPMSGGLCVFSVVAGTHHHRHPCSETPTNPFGFGHLPVSLCVPGWVFVLSCLSLSLVVTSVDACRGSKHPGPVHGSGRQGCQVRVPRPSVPPAPGRPQLWGQ